MRKAFKASVDIDIDTCGECGGVRIITSIEDPAVIKNTLALYS